MPKPRPTFLKRQRERKLAEKRAEKARKRSERKDNEDAPEGVAEGEDPDLAGMTPGPHNVAPWVDEDGDKGEA